MESTSADIIESFIQSRSVAGPLSDFDLFVVDLLLAPCVSAPQMELKSQHAGSDAPQGSSGTMHSNQSPGLPLSSKQALMAHRDTFVPGALLKCTAAAFNTFIQGYRIDAGLVNAIRDAKRRYANRIHKRNSRKRAAVHRAQVQGRAMAAEDSGAAFVEDQLDMPAVFKELQAATGRIMSKVAGDE